MRLVASIKNIHTIRFSKMEWKSIGLRAGWLKIATVGYMSAEEYVRRLKAIGWTINPSKRASHIEIKAPNGRNLVGFSTNNWEQNWGKQKQDLRKISSNLDFVWRTPFEIPEGFDQMTFQINGKKPYMEDKFTFMQLHQSPPNLEIFHNGEFKTPVEVDFANFQVLLDNGDIVQYKPSSVLSVRFPNV